MEYKEFIKKFVPDCENRLYKWDATRGSDDKFCSLVFSEALDNFADRICKKQQEMCKERYSTVEFDDFMADYIAQAPQPKTNEL